jgi:hypothetical protein
MADQRKKFLIDAQVQGVLVRRLVLHWCAFIVVASVASVLLKLLLDPFRPFDQILRESWSSIGPLVFVSVLLIPVFIRDSIQLSHRFVGPVKRLRTMLKALARGEDVKPLTLRPEDYWLEIADEFNDVLRRFQELEQKVAQQRSDADSSSPELVTQ